jgi:hypothetical protein
MKEQEKEQLRKSTFTQNKMKEAFQKVKEEVAKPRKFDITADLEIAKDLRKDYLHTGGFTKERLQRHVAKIPYVEYLMAVRKDPMVFKNKKKFRKWIAKRPQYRVVSKI